MMKLLAMHPSATTFSNTINPCSSLGVRDHVSHQLHRTESFLRRKSHSS